MTPKESGHWYAQDGTPVYEVANKSKGGMRPATLRDARKMNLFPGYSTIANQLEKPGVTKWRIRQAILSSLTLPKIDGESLDDFADRALIDSEEQSRQAMARGTAIHAAIEQYFAGDIPSKDYDLHCTNTERVLCDWLFSFTDIRTANIYPEKSFAHPLGYGGKVDLHGDGWVVDIKTKDKPLDSVSIYPENIMQLAAYSVGLNVSLVVRAAIIHVHIDGGAKLTEVSRDDLIDGWEKFRRLLEIWQIENKYKPEWR